MYDYLLSSTNSCQKVPDNQESLFYCAFPFNVGNTTDTSVLKRYPVDIYQMPCY